MTTFNDIYPEDYFSLPGTSSVGTPNELWWSSVERLPPAAEFVEIDLGKKRTINFISFDIINKPIDIEIEYDVTSFSNGAHTWTSVSPLRDRPYTKDSVGEPVPVDLLQEYFDPTAPFDDTIIFTGSSNPWSHCQFYFTDATGASVTTRYLRIRFTRRSESWPASNMSFPWSIDVTNFRTARYIISLDDARGLLVDTDTYNASVRIQPPKIFDIRQNISMPFGYVRGDQTVVPPRDASITPVVPNLVGFGFLASLTGPEDIDASLTSQYVVFDWELWDMSNNGAKKVKSGRVSGAAISAGDCWIDVFFDSRSPVPTRSDSLFQVRIVNQSATNWCNTLRTQNPATLTDAFYVTSRTAQGAIETDQIVGQNLCIRVWADIGESGIDVLGNQYREGLRRDSADRVLDNNIGTQWVSAPNPSPNGVECLYFDVRTEKDDGTLVPTVIDSLRVDPLWPGPYMHIYSSNDSPTGSAPRTPQDWEQMMWEPVHADYILTGNSIIDMPRPVLASWMCLEFSNLQPIPFSIPSYPHLPAMVYKEYPQWVASAFQHVATRKPVGNVVTVGLTPTDLYSLPPDITTEASTQGNLTKPSTSMAVGVIDPFTASQIKYNTAGAYQQILQSQTNLGTVLGALTNNIVNANPDVYPVETRVSPSLPVVTDVSNVNARDKQALSTVSNPPMYFNQPSRHFYAIRHASLNKKAYFVGIAEVQFFRKDFTIARDDSVIFDVIGDLDPSTSPNVSLNTWVQETRVTIPLGSTIYICYTLGGINYEDEAITFEGASETNPNFDFVPFSKSGAKATAILAHSGPDQTGVQYVLGQDYDVNYDPDTLTNSIRRSAFSYRLVASDTVSVTADTGLVASRAVISGSDVRSYASDAATIIGVTVIVLGDEERITAAGVSQYIERIGVASKAVIFTGEQTI